MFRKLFRSNIDSCLSLKKQARLSELKEYLCLREGLNPSASEKSTADFKALAAKYKLTGRQLTDLFSLLGTDLRAYQRNLTPQDASTHRELIEVAYRKNSFYNGNASIEETVKALRSKYPDVATYTSRQSERVKAIQELEAVFLVPGLKNTAGGDDVAVLRLNETFHKNAKGLISSLAQDTQAQNVANPHNGGSTETQEIIQAINKVFNKLTLQLEASPAKTYGLIKSFLEHNEIRGLNQSTEVVTRGRVEDGMTVVKQEDRDFPQIEEDFEAGNQEGAKLYFQTLVNEKKVIYEASELPTDYSTYYRALVGLSATLILYKLYQGDATLLQYSGLAILAGYSAYRGGVQAFRNRFSYLAQISASRDGKLLDLYLRQPGSNKIKVVEGVPAEDFRIHRGEYTWKAANDETFNLGDLKAHGIGSSTWVGSYGSEVVLVPQVYTGSNPDLDKLFQGRRQIA